MAYRIYLCGGMTGLSEEAQKGWRSSVKNEISQYVRQGTIDFFDPTEYDASGYVSCKQEAEEIAMKLDVRNLISSNLVICNISANPYSVGTNMELGICHNLHIPVITYNPNGVELHPWQEKISDFVVTDLDRLTDIVRDYYLPRHITA